ncbi:hypothetical protein ACHAXS_007114 [Conticribra weissflogii]
MATLLHFYQMLLGLLIFPLISTTARLRVQNASLNIRNTRKDLNIRNARKDNYETENHAIGIRELDCGGLLSIALDSDEDSSGGLNIDEFYSFLYGISPDFFNGDGSQGDPGFFRTRVFYRDGIFEVQYLSLKDDAPPHFVVFFQLVDMKNVEENEVIEVSLTGFLKLFSKRTRQERTYQLLFCDSVFDALDGYVLAQNSTNDSGRVQEDEVDKKQDGDESGEELVGGLKTRAASTKSAAFNLIMPESTTTNERTTKTTIPTTAIGGIISDEITTLAAVNADDTTPAEIICSTSRPMRAATTELVSSLLVKPAVTESKVTEATTKGVGSATTSVRGDTSETEESTTLDELTANDFLVSTMNSYSTKPNTSATTTGTAISETEEPETAAPRMTTIATTSTGREQTTARAGVTASSETTTADEASTSMNVSSTKPKTNESKSSEIEKPIISSSTTVSIKTEFKTTEISSETHAVVNIAESTVAPSGKPKEITTTIAEMLAETTTLPTSKASKTTASNPAISKHNSSTEASYITDANEANLSTTTDAASTSKTAGATKTSTAAANKVTMVLTSSSPLRTTSATISPNTGSVYTTSSPELPMDSSRGKRIRDETENMFAYSGELDDASTESQPLSDGVVVGVFAAVAAVILVIVVIVTQHPFFNPRDPMP